MQKFQEEFLKRRQKKETRLFNKNKKNKIRGRSFQEENYSFFRTLRIKGKHFQKRIIKL